MGSHLPSHDAWTRARNRYVEDLTDEEKQLYLQASPEMIFYDASAAEKRHGATSTSRGLMNKLRPFVAAIEQYGQALDVYSNAYPLALSPIWGSVRVLLMIAREFGKYFEKLVDMFARIGDVLPRFQIYEKLFPHHERLTQALSIAYVDVIAFCSDAKAVFRRGQRASLTSFKVGFKLMWKPFESQFGQQLDNFRNHQKNVEKEAGLSHMVEAADARTLALANHLQLEKTKKENEHRRILAMIASVDVETKHRKLQSQRFNGTGEWLLQNDKYLEWKSGSSPSSLCCYGIPGSGKSVLASRVIDDLSLTASAPQVAVVYYYCDYADQRTLQTDRILGTIMKQLIPEDHFPQEIEPQILRAYKGDTRSPGSSELMALVISLIQLRSTVYIVLDGLDECEKPSKQELLSFLDRLSTLGKASVRTFVSSRDEDQLMRSLKSYNRIQLTATALGNDIKSFVEGSVRSKIQSCQLLIRNPDLERQIVEELVDKAHGMFLWVFFQLDDLCEAPSDAMIRQTLRDLPVGLVQTYERILHKISKSPLAKKETALRAFKWTVCSRRPMKAKELREAVAFVSSDMSWDIDKIPDENFMIEACRGLLVRDEEDRTVRFAHHTVHQYLLSAPAIMTQEGSCFAMPPHSEAETFVGQVCIAYLCFSDFETQIALRTSGLHVEHPVVVKVGGPILIPSVLGIAKSLLEIPYRLLDRKSVTASLDINYSKYLTPSAPMLPQVPSDLMEKYQLLDYIVEYWIDHTQRLQPTFQAKLRHLVMHKTLPFEFRPWGPNQHFGPYGCTSCPDLAKAKELPFMSLFHYAAQVGHWKLMESLVTEYCQHEMPLDETLLIACRHGQTLIVQNLIRRIQFDVSDGRALNVAIAAGHADLAEYLLDLQPKITEFAKYLPWSSDPKFVSNVSSLLDLAATSGHEKVVDTILTYYRSKGPNDNELSIYINKKNEGTGRTAFFSAVKYGHENIVRNLLRRGAEINAHGNTAIHIAAEDGNLPILQILLEMATKCVESKSNVRKSYIHSESVPYATEALAAYLGDWLLFTDSRRKIPLHKAARNGHTAAVEMILEYLPRHFVEEKTPGLAKIPRMSLRIQIDGIDSRNLEGYTPLHLAAIGGHQDVLKTLVGEVGDGARIGARIELTTDDFGLTALHLAAIQGHEAVIQCLLETGARPQAEDGNGRKALSLAMHGGHDGVVEAILRSHPETSMAFDEYDHGGNVITMIEIAAKNGDDSFLRTFFANGGLLDTSTGTEVLKSALNVAESEKRYATTELLTSFLETQSTNPVNV